MSTTEAPPSSPGMPAAGASVEEELAYYKGQYEQLESELQDFQASSRELEQELEKDIDASEKRERKLKERVESLGYEVEEWKAKYKQAKTEANSAQNNLQKEITSLRDSQRTLQLKLRDIEVVNDDFERQARNTTSSLDDLEQKHNQAIERGVMLEEEIKIVELDRENLRIETQRLRDELSDLRIETEIVQEKLRQAETTIESHHEQKSHHLAVDGARPRSPMSETSTSATTLSSPTTSTPPTKDPSGLADAHTPPSPPLSEVSAAAKNVPSTPLPTRKKSIAIHSDATPRPGYYSSRAPRHSRGPSLQVGMTGRSTPSVPRRAPPSSAPRPSVGPSELPRSGSLYQIRGLIGKMQKLEERVHSARSKLPGPVNTPPRASPRNGSALGHHLPSTVTVRSNRKRSSAAGSTSSYGTHGAAGETNGLSAAGRKSVSRLSFGGSQRPPSALDNPPQSSRPSSRASATSSQPYVRPASRSSITGARTPMGNYPSALHRPRSSLSLTNDDKGDDGLITPVARRTTLDKGLTGIPTPSALPRRQSGGIPRRASAVGLDGVEMPPPSTTTRARKLSDLGESY